MLMCDLGSVYYQVASIISQVLLWSRGPPSVVCDCHCDERESNQLENCNQVVRDLISACLEGPSSSVTSTTTVALRKSWDFGWLWLLVIVFLIGWLLGRSNCEHRQKHQALTAPALVSSGSEGSSPRPRRGVAA